MKRYLVLTLAFLMAATMVVSAEFNPSEAENFYEAVNVSFTQAKETAGDYTVVSNGNPALTGDGYSKTYTGTGGEGICLMATSATGGNKTGLVDNEGNGFRIPASSAGYTDATATDTYYYEFGMNVAGLGSGQFRIMIRNDANKTLASVRMTASTIAGYVADNTSKGKVGEYTIPEASRSKTFTLGVAITPATETLTVFLNNNKVIHGAPASSLISGRVPSGDIQYYFTSSPAGCSLGLTTFAQYRAEGAFDFSTASSFTPSAENGFVKGNSLTYTATGVTGGQLLLPNTTYDKYTMTYQVTDAEPENPAVTLKATEAGGLPTITFPGGRSSKFWWGTNAGYTHYWELSTNLSAAPSGAYRMYINGLSGAGKDQKLATLVIGKGYLEFGGKEDVGSSQSGYVGVYFIPQAVREKDMVIGVSFDPATYTMTAYLNGTPVLSRQCDVYKSYYDNMYPSGGSVQLYSMQNGEADAAIQLKGFRAGYVKTADITPEGDLELMNLGFDSTLAAAQQNGTATASLTAMKDGGAAYSDVITLLISVFDSNGRLVSITPQVKRVAGGDTVAISAAADTVEEGYSVRAFVWNGTTLKPLMGSKTMQ